MISCVFVIIGSHCEMLLPDFLKSQVLVLWTAAVLKNTDRGSSAGCCTEITFSCFPARALVLSWWACRWITGLQLHPWTERETRRRRTPPLPKTHWNALSGPSRSAGYLPAVRLLPLQRCPWLLWQKRRTRKVKWPIYCCQGPRMQCCSPCSAAPGLPDLSVLIAP